MRWFAPWTRSKSRAPRSTRLTPSRFPILTLCAAATTSSSTRTSPGTASRRWRDFRPERRAKFAAFPEPAEELLGASAGGKMYVFCGYAPGFKPIGMVYEYDPITDKWAKKRPTALAASVGDKIYVIGGAVPGPNQPSVHPLRPHTSVGTIEEYDPATNTWRERAPMPTPRNHAVAGSAGGKVYVIGGRLGAAFMNPGGSNNVGVVEAYDPATDSWSQGLARMPTARSAGAAGVYGGRIYVTGGEYQDYRMMATLRSFEAYDPATNTWQTLPSLPVSRHGLAGAVVGNRLHMVSGDVQSAGTGVHVHTESHDAYEFDGGKK